MKNKDLDKKTSSTLPLYGKIQTHAEESQHESGQPSSFDLSSVHDLIGTRSERRECSVGVRVTREMKAILEELSSKSRLSESEVVFRILKKNLISSSLD